MKWLSISVVIGCSVHAQQLTVVVGGVEILRKEVTMRFFWFHQRAQVPFVRDKLSVISPRQGARVTAAHLPPGRTSTAGRQSRVRERRGIR